MEGFRFWVASCRGLGIPEEDQGGVYQQNAYRSPQRGTPKDSGAQLSIRNCGAKVLGLLMP